MIPPWDGGSQPSRNLAAATCAWWSGRRKTTFMLLRSARTEEQQSDMRANTYDPDADAAYIVVGEGPIADTDELAPGIVADFDAQGRLVGIELLSVSKTLAPGSWKNWPLPGVDAHAHAAE